MNFTYFLKSQLEEFLLKKGNSLYCVDFPLIHKILYILHILLFPLLNSLLFSRVLSKSISISFLLQQEAFFETSHRQKLLFGAFLQKSSEITIVHCFKRTHTRKFNKNKNINNVRWNICTSKFNYAENVFTEPNV